MESSVTREDAHRLVELLPPAFSWDDLMQAIYRRASLERGLADGATGRVTAVSALRAEFKVGPHECTRLFDAGEAD